MPRAIHAIDPDVEVIESAAPLFVPLAEEGWANTHVAREVAEIYLEPLGSDVLFGASMPAAFQIDVGLDRRSRDRDSRRQADDWYRIAVENGAKPLISFSSRFNTKRRPSVSCSFARLSSNIRVSRSDISRR